MTAIRDTTIEINNAVKDLKKIGIINDAATTLEEGTKAVRDTNRIAKDEI